VRPDGSVYREIYAKGDSAFLAGDRSKSPYLFQLDSAWQISRLNVNSDSKFFKEYNVKIGKTFKNAEEINAGLRFDEIYRPLVAPVETIHKRFRWFYTYYSYKAVYKDITDKISVPLDDFLNVSEQKLWFKGDFSAYADMNGIELKNEMDIIERRFWEWYARNVYEVMIEAIIDYEKSISGQYVSKIQALKDTVFLSVLAKHEFLENDPFETVDLYKALDKQLNTGYFSGLYRDNQIAIDSLVEAKGACINDLTDKLFQVDVEYQLLMPGKLICSNAPVQYQDTLSWKVNALRFVSGDYVLTAESRTVHVWAFILTFMLLALSAGCWIATKKRCCFFGFTKKKQ
jgi:hypothetical protein